MFLMPLRGWWWISRGAGLVVLMTSPVSQRVRRKPGEGQKCKHHSNFSRKGSEGLILVSNGPLKIALCVGRGVQGSDLPLKEKNGKKGGF